MSIVTKRSRMSAESLLTIAPDEEEDWICSAGNLGSRASEKLQPWHSFLKRNIECDPCPEGRWAQPSNLRLGHVPELPTPAPLRCGEGKWNPEQCGRKKPRAHEYHVTCPKHFHSTPFDQFTPDPCNSFLSPIRSRTLHYGLKIFCDESWARLNCIYCHVFAIPRHPMGRENSSSWGKLGQFKAIHYLCTAHT
jgi:hypothetical protein